MMMRHSRRQGGAAGPGSGGRTVFLLATLLAALLPALLAGCAEKQVPGPAGPAIPDVGGAPAASAPAASAPVASTPPASAGVEPINALTIHHEVRQAVEALVRAKNTRDVLAILACYDPEARVMTWIPDQGRDALAPLAVFREMLPGKVQGWALADRRHELLSVDEPILHGKEIWCTYVVRISEGQGEEAAQVRARFTTRLLRQDGRWLVVEERYAKVD
ncbi:MAG: nuclear transport factor 2 family protein [Desulfovibrio sp.]|nr:nuclear transport factor 2 family protein [Desulfovibrio sp.]MCA1986357.1 nuclear transport factor 2 family protein [Desulfovibrio sp.]